MADTAQRRADAQITKNIFRSCEADDDRSFSFDCAPSEKMETARLVARTTQDHFGAFASRPAQPRYESKESPTSHVLLTDQNRSCSQQNSAKIYGRCKHSKSFGRDQDSAAFRALLLSSPDSYELCPADDLFYKGQLLPLYTHYRTRMFQGMVSLPQLQAERELSGIPPRSSLDNVDQLSSSFLSEFSKRIEMPLQRCARLDDTPQQEPRIIQRLQQPALVHPDPLGTSNDDAAGQMLCHRQPSFQNRKSGLILDPAVWISSEKNSPTHDFKREVEYKSSASSCFASPDNDCYHGRNNDRSDKKSQRSSKAIALAYWHKSIRMLFKPLDRLHSKDNDQRWDNTSMSPPRTVWFSDCKETGTTIANSVHNMRSDRSGQMQKRCRRKPDSFLRSNQSTPAAGIKYEVEANGPRWQDSMYKRAEQHIGIEGAIAHCKQSQEARR